MRNYYCWNLDGLAKFNTFIPFFAGSDETRFIYPPDALADSAHHKHFSKRTTVLHRSTQTEGTSSSSQMQSSLLCPSGPPLTPCPSPILQRKRVCANKTPNTLNSAEENKPSYEALEKVYKIFILNTYLNLLSTLQKKMSVYYLAMNTHTLA